MSRFVALFGAASLMIFGAQTGSVRADSGNATLVITATNDPAANAIQVYDAATRSLLQTLPTQGQGGVGGNARGVRQYNGLVAAVNNGSNSVAVYRRQGNGL
jgi:hypothetical protein